jgi:hypothetical protein
MIPLRLLREYLAITTKTLHKTLSLLLLSIAFSACQTPDSELIAAQVSEARRVALRASAQTALKEGRELYDRGDYSGTIKKLMGTQELFQTDTDVQLEAYKYLAFSYCLSKRQTQCADSFNKAFALDSSFDLAPAERGHPMWGPVFDRVKKARPKQ